MDEAVLRIVMQDDGGTPATAQPTYVPPPPVHITTPQSAQTTKPPTPPPTHIPPITVQSSPQSTTQAASNSYKQPNNYDGQSIRDLIKARGDDASVAFDEIREQMKDHLATGGGVSLHTDGKEIPITKIDNNRAFDAKGQQWGLLPFAAGNDANPTGIKFHPPKTPLQPTVPTQSTPTPPQPTHGANGLRLTADQIDAANNQQTPMPPATVPLFNPVEAAKKRVEREQQQAATDAEYVKLKPPPPLPFDPVALAKGRVDREKQQALVDAEYAKMKPLVQDRFGGILKIADAMRGTIGGIFGTLVGTTLDVIHAYRASYPSKESTTAAANTPTQPPQPPPVPTTTPLATLPTPPASTQSQPGTQPTIIRPTPAPAQSAQAPTQPAPTQPVAPKTTQPTPVPAQPTTTQPATVPAKAAAQTGTDAAAATTGATEGAAAGAAGLAAAAVPIAVFTVAIVAAAKAVEALIDFINKSEQKYGEYSPQIAQAQAIAEVRTVMGDMRRAQTVSADLANYIKARTDVEQKYEDIKVQFLSKILPAVTVIIDLLEPALVAVETAIDLLQPLQDIADMVKDIKDAIPNISSDDKAKEIEDPTSYIFKNNGADIRVPSF